MMGRGTTPRRAGGCRAACLLLTLTVMLCGTVGSANAQAQAKADAEIKNREGKKVGEAVLEQRPDGVSIAVTFTDLPPGTRAFHVHEIGKCEPPFESAGKHFNPTGKEHGRQNPRGHHAGDLPNIVVPDSGRLKVEIVVPEVSLASGPANLLDTDGASLVVHERADDERTDPAGNAGGRIACGVIKK